MSRRIAADNAREKLVAQLVDEEQPPREVANIPVTTADPPLSDAEFKQRHKELVRAAGRAALEESLLSQESHRVKRKASEITASGITAQWQAYAEVYGTNGMAAGGARSSLVDPPPEDDDEHDDEDEDEKEDDDEADSPAAAPEETEQPEVVAEVPAEASADTRQQRLAIWDF